MSQAHQSGATAAGSIGVDEWYGTAFDASPLGIALYGPEAQLLEANRAFLSMHRASLEELRSVDSMALVHPEDRGAVAAAFVRLATREIEELDHEARMVRLDGTTFSCRTRLTSVWDTDGQPRLTVLIAEDVTADRERSIALRRSEEQLRAVLDNAPLAFWRWDGELRLTFVSAAMQEIFDVDPAEMIGARLDTVVVEPALRRDLERSLSSVLETGAKVDSELELDTPTGRRVLACRYAPECGDDGMVVAVIAIVDDVTALRRSQDVLEHQARHDPLTGLVNRGHLERILPELIAQERISALLYIDLDHFKEANDSLGHSAGDELLRVVARRIAGVVRQNDVIARLGGDEFVVLLGIEAEAAGPWNIAARLRRAVAAPCWIGGEQVVVTASIGVARPTDPGTTGDELLRRGDRAMYHAKSHGRDRTEELDAPSDVTEQSLLARRGELRDALTNGELELHYQPEVGLDDGVVCGAEALIRWNHPTRGLVSAASFIGLAEDAGMMQPIGRFVIERACEAAHRFQVEFGPSFTTRINLSARQIDDDDLELTLDDALLASGARPESICLEITETAVMRDAHVVLRRLHSLRDRGFRLAIDDFGTGYSSLSYLKRFPIDVLKIDRSFVDGLGEDPHDTTIVAAIVQMASALGLEVVAEGVETETQRVELLRLGCERGQGYLFARPMRLDDLFAWGAALVRG